MSIDMPNLFSPFRLGAIELARRVVHAPTTCLRAEEDLSPSAMMLDYYRQRTSAGGLLITESTHPSFDSRGYEGAPGVYTDAHVASWTKLADVVHARGGRIVMQLGHDGRQSHSDLSHGAAPIAPSVVPFEGQALTKNGWVPVSPHREIGIEEIPALVESFRRASARAKAAGFDGVELHNANGYLVDTFLQDGTNKRTDIYGGCYATRFSMAPIPSISQRTISPELRKRGGSIPIPTPSGLPVAIRSPGSSVKAVER